jgi:hypothetical protein
MSAHSSKFSRISLSLASAALAMHSAAAAEAVGDLQQQMRHMLAGASVSHPAARTEPPNDRSATPSVDAQEYMKQVLLGLRAVRVEEGSRDLAQAKATSHLGPTFGPETQASVQSFLLGTHTSTGHGG